MGPMLAHKTVPLSQSKGTTSRYSFPEQIKKTVLKCYALDEAFFQTQIPKSEKHLLETLHVSEQRNVYSVHN